MNILISSVGRRVQLINYFKNELSKVNGKVLAIDCDPTAPALYHADFFEIVPRIDHPEYKNIIKNLCKKYEIKGVLSLIDPELPILSGMKEEFAEDDVHLIVAEKEVIDICYDKYLTYKFLKEHGLPAVPTYAELNEVIEDLNNGKISFPLILKPKNGSGSNGVRKVTNSNDLQIHWEGNRDLIAQPFMEGSEYCVECYIDLITNQTTSLFSKRKINMRAGETDKSIAIKDPVLNELTDQLIETLRPAGPVDIDFFKTKEGYVISEINPRFGGGYPYAYEMGQNFIENIINNLKGIPNQPFEKC
ncbi:ATP-grasp domain-containing protein, partial [Neobacillus niacini]|uniref:ATP-grasp domain-containing protein n=1 Tax=Neobacillus niacini TaxID=86668 RepID=UPI002FFF09B7